MRQDMTPDKDLGGRSAEVRKIPKADLLLGAAERVGLVARLGHAPVMEAVRAVLDEVRARVLAGEPCPAPRTSRRRSSGGSRRAPGVPCGGW